MPPKKLARLSARRILNFHFLRVSFSLAVFLLLIQFLGSSTVTGLGIHADSGDNGSANTDKIRKEFKNPPKSSEVSHLFLRFPTHSTFTSIDRPARRFPSRALK